jgi:hypothetical protein
MKQISSPIVAEVGSVTVKGELVVLQKYPYPAVALEGSAVMTACQDMPDPLDVPDAADVILPCASTVMLVFVYDPAVTAVFAS